MTPEPARRIATLITGATGARTDQGAAAVGLPGGGQPCPSPQERHRRAG
jgi:hypothetical protein